MTDARIALLPGDGIGPEVIDAAVRVIDAVGARFGRHVDLKAWPIGGVALRSHGAALPDATLQACMDAHAVLLGAVGDPAFDDAPRNARPETGLLALRKALGVYANLRPAKIWPGLEDIAPLRPERIAGCDMVIVRELTGGLYFGEPRGFDADDRGGFNTMRYSVDEVERVAVSAFDLARGRRKLLTSVDKANVLETSQLWRRTVVQVAARYPDVRLEHLYVDACAMELALRPARFDVMLTENLFGDILSDEAAAVVGSLGLAPSASLGAGRGLYEPVHGSAPTLAGKDIANPVGAIASAAMLLRHSLHWDVEADAVEAAIGAVLAAGVRTADIAAAGQPAASTSAFTAAVIDRLRDAAGDAQTRARAASLQA